MSRLSGTVRWKIGRVVGKTESCILARSLLNAASGNGDLRVDAAALTIHGVGDELSPMRATGVLRLSSTIPSVRRSDIEAVHQPASTRSHIDRLSKIMDGWADIGRSHEPTVKVTLISLRF